jgi:hypothetical protein
MTPPRLLAPLLLLALAGCALAPGEAPPRPPVSNTVSRGSEGGGRFIALVGSPQQFAPPFLGVAGTNFALLRSWIDTKTGEGLIQLYVEVSYAGDARTYDAAHDSSGGALKFVPISKNEIACENGCSYAEEFAAELPVTLLDAHRQGLTVVFAAKSGPDLSIALTGEAIVKQLAALASAGAVPTAAASPPKAPQP